MQTSDARKRAAENQRPVQHESTRAKCPGALSIGGEQFSCQMSAPHDGWAHSNHEAMAIWADTARAVDRSVAARTFVRKMVDGLHRWLS